MAERHAVPQRPGRDRQDRAKRVMTVTAVLCVLAAATPASERLASTGWQSFITRPAGIGASAARSEDAVALAPPLAPLRSTTVDPPPATVGQTGADGAGAAATPSTAAASASHPRVHEAVRQRSGRRR